MVLVTIAFASCSKDNPKVLGDHYEKTGSIGDPFNIYCASLEEGTVALELFHGGKEDHKFSYSWDGKISVPYPDSCSTCSQIEIKISHDSKNENNSSLDYKQTVSFKLADINIKASDLTHVVFLKITNSIDETNSIPLQWSASGLMRNGECVWGDSNDPVNPDMIYSLPVLVVESTCEMGSWENLWLKVDVAEGSTDKPSFTYLMPVKDFSADSCGFIPQLGDKLIGSFRKVKYDDLCTDRKSDTQPADVFYLRKR